MLSDAQIESLALYFYFMFLDETRAQAATARAVRKARSELFGPAAMGSAKSPEMISRTLLKIADQEVRSRKRESRPVGLAFMSGHVQLPEKSNWGPWFEFRKLADPKDFEAVLCNKILNIPEAVLADTYGVAEGTVRYRVGRGLKLLGKICLSGGYNA